MVSEITPETQVPIEESRFAAALRSDYRRAEAAVRAMTPAGVELSEAQQATLKILARLYPLLRGKLYPEKSSLKIAQKLLETISQHQPVTLCGVLALGTALKELPYFDRAIHAFSDCYPSVNIWALLLDWPKLEARRQSHGFELLTGDNELVVKSVAERTDVVRQRWSTLGYKEVDLEVVPILLRSKWERWVGQKTGLFEPEDFAEIARKVIKGDDKELQKSLAWLLNFLHRQETMRGLSEPELLAEAQFGSTMRRGIGQRLEQVTMKNPGLTLGITTELNPSLLRCYGKNIHLANIDVRKPL